MNYGIRSVQKELLTFGLHPLHLIYRTPLKICIFAPHKLFRRPHHEPIVISRLAQPGTSPPLVLWFPHASGACARQENLWKLSALATHDGLRPAPSGCQLFRSSLLHHTPLEPSRHHPDEHGDLFPLLLVFQRCHDDAAETELYLTKKIYLSHLLVAGLKD